ncbi:MAG: hypothetical protein NVSMB38_10960 [Ktedonobacteraceae bacterium]
MSNPPTLEKTSGTADARIPIPRLPMTSGTLRSSSVHVWIAKSIEDMYIRTYHALVPKRTIEEEEAEEQEWHDILSQPHVQQGLLRLAEGIRRQIAAGETEEGGFAVE